MSRPPPASLKYLESCFLDFPQNWRTKYLGQQEVIRKSEQLDSLKIMTIYGFPEMWFPLSSEKYLVLISAFLVKIHLHFSFLNNCQPDGLRLFIAIIMFVEILSCFSCFPFLKGNQISDHQQ